MLRPILAHSLNLVNEARELFDTNNNSNLNICFGRAVVNTRHKTRILSHSGFIAFNIESLQVGFDDGLGFKAEVEKALKKLDDEKLLLQNLSSGACLLTDEQLEERKYTGIRKEDILGYPIIIIEADCSPELQKAFFEGFWTHFTGLPTPMMIYSGGRSYHCLFFLDRLITVEEHTAIQKLVSKIEFWEKEEISEEITQVKKSLNDLKNEKIKNVKAEFKKDINSMSDDIKALFKNYCKKNTKKNKEITLRKIIKEIRVDYIKNLDSGIKAIKEKYKNDILKFDCLGANAKFRVPDVERHKVIASVRKDGKIEVIPTGINQEVYNVADTDDDRLKDFTSVTELFHSLGALSEMNNPYFDIDPEDKVYIEYARNEIAQTVNGIDDNGNEIELKKNTDDYSEIKRQICESKQHEIISYYNASHMRINPQQGVYDIAPDDWYRGKKEKRGILRVYNDTGHVTIQSFKEGSEFNVGGKPLNITLDYFRRTNFDIHAETMKQLLSGNKIFENVGKKLAKKKYNVDAFKAFFYSNRTNLYSNQKYIDPQIVLDFIDSKDEKVLILQGKTGLGKTSTGLHMAKKLDICNMVLIPYISIKQGKYEAIYNDPSNDKGKLRGELTKIGITNEDEVNHIINAHSDKRVLFFCPEGYINQCNLEEILQENEKNNITTVLTIDEGHSILGKTQFRDSYVKLLNDFCYCLQRYNLKVILLSATITNQTYKLIQGKARLKDNQLKWINFIPEGQKDIEFDLLYLPHNNDPQEIICDMIRFYKEALASGNIEVWKKVYGISNVEYIKQIKEAMDNSKEWQEFEKEVGIDLIYSSLIKVKDKKQTKKSLRLIALLETITEENTEAILEDIISACEADIKLNKKGDNARYLTPSQYETVKHLKKKTNRKGELLTAEYILQYIKRHFVKQTREKYIDVLLTDNKLSSMFTFITSCGYEGIDIIDPTVKEATIVANDVTWNEEHWIQFVGRFRLGGVKFQLILPNAKSNRRVQTLHSVEGMIDSLIEADGKYSLCDFDYLYKDMVVKHKLSTVISISELLKRAKMQWLKNHDLLLEYLACHDVKINKIEHRDSAYYKALEGTEEREIKKGYNKGRKIARTLNLIGNLTLNNYYILWLNGKKEEVPMSVRHYCTDMFGSIGKAGQFTSNGHIQDILRIENFRGCIIEYINMLNVAYKLFNHDEFTLVVRFIMALPKLYFKEISKLFKDQNRILKALKADIQGEDEEDTIKKQAHKSYQIRNIIIKNIKDRIKNITLNFDRNSKRVFMFDCEDLVLSKLLEAICHINYKDEFVICFADLKNKYKSNQVPIKKLLKEKTPKLTDKQLIKEAQTILETKVNILDEFKETFNFYETAILVEAIKRITFKKTGKEFVSNDFDKERLRKRVLHHGSQAQYRDCVVRRYNYLSIRLLDTFKGTGKTREIVIPYTVKKLKLMILNASNVSPPQGIET